MVVVSSFPKLGHYLNGGHFHRAKHGFFPEPELHNVQKEMNQSHSGTYLIG